MKEIDITIDTNGVTEIDLKGFQGKGCSEITNKLAKALGEINNRTLKNEYYKSKQKVHAKQRL